MNYNHPGAIVTLVSEIRRLSNAFIEERLRSCGAGELQPIHGVLLSILYHADGPLQMKEIPKRIGRTKSTVNSLAETLEKKGYVRRSACTRDGRCTYLGLTEKAETFRPFFQNISRELAEFIWRDFSPEETQILMVLLNKLRSGLLSYADSQKFDVEQ
jgi:DNA-binding MarR family transcriptional regulator